MSSIQKTFAIIDAHIAEIKAATAERGKPVTCRGSGCFGCCKEPVHVEAREVQWAIDGLSVADRAYVKGRTAEWQQKFYQGGFDQWGPPDAPGPGNSFGAILRYRATNLWCPLLKDGKCLAYARRPISCRLHLAVGDPEKCHDDGRRPTQVYALSEQTATANFQAMAVLVTGRSAVFNFDHLGMLLARLLLRDKRQSLAAQSFTMQEADKQEACT